MDDKYYMDVMISYLNQFGHGTKSDFIKLLSDKFSDVLDDKQKEIKVKNYLMYLRKAKTIKYINGNRRTGVWVLDNNDSFS